MANIDIDTNKLRECGNDIMTLTSELNDTLLAMYNRINGITTKTLEWSGSAADEFVRKANAEIRYYLEFKESLYKYGNLYTYIADEIDTDLKRIEIK